ncbi:MAG: DUF4388 domain-containing protein [Thermomicrobiales bacterium]|nr:DUF4388 domain-containing protein [Thermomicrobiales bacterium]
MSTIGELSDFGVADLIDILTRRERTGRLAVKSGGQEVYLYFERGQLVLIGTTDITLRLGRLLIRQGLLDTPRLLDALHAQAESGSKKPLGTILIERGWITPADLARCVEEQSIEALARAVMDLPGLFVFDAGITRPAHLELSSLDPATLLAAAQERVDAILLLRNQLPPETTPLFLNPATTGANRATDELGPPEAMVVSVLRTGAKTYAELSFHLALDELTLGVAVLSLIERGTLLAGPERIAPNGHSTRSLVSA